MTTNNLIAVIALFGIAIFASNANASCGSSHRVEASNSDCLTETHSDGGYSANNHCLHEIKIKVDIRNASDQTRTIASAALTGCVRTPGHLTCGVVTDVQDADDVSPTVVTGSTATSFGRRIRSVKCCSDHSDCNRLASEEYPS